MITHCITSSNITNEIGDWIWTEVSLADQTYFDLLESVDDTPAYQETINRGLAEGWLTIVGPIDLRE